MPDVEHYNSDQGDGSAVRVQADFVIDERGYPRPQLTTLITTHLARDTQHATKLALETTLRVRGCNTLFTTEAVDRETAEIWVSGDKEVDALIELLEWSASQLRAQVAAVRAVRDEGRAP